MANHNKAIGILGFMIIQLSPVYSQTSGNLEGKHKEFFVGVNLMTPFGGMKTQTNSFNANNTTVSDVSLNTCISFHLEYKIGKLALRVPVRIPLTQYEATTSNTSSYYYYYSNSAQSFVNYEIGIVPTIYFLESESKIQPFFYLGLHIGEDYSLFVNNIENYGPNTSGYYSDLISSESSLSVLPNSMYTRYSFGTGARLKLGERFGIETDLNVFFRRGNGFSYESTSNYGDGVYTTYPDYSNNRISFGTQFGLNVTYKIL